MNEEQRNKLWADYAKQKSPDIREKLIIEYAGLVKVVAGRLSMYLGYTVEYDDLVGYGTFGLIDAIDKFDSLKGVKFETYASLRIRGAILDQIRKMDWIPRTLRQKQKKLETAYQKLEAEHGRPGTEEEVAEELEISVDELNSWQNQTKVTNLISLDEFLEQGSEIRVDSNTSIQFQQPERIIEREELKKILAEVLEELTENERKVILFYYYEELTLKEISRILEVSESRISQLHTKALKKMKVKLGENMELFYGF
ncbi:FliA/WhiG family RNA polymerase sigma factor [Velocimicrobium porci]|uniref:FliA/WhiG family RNA polymerase sigma factor n=1 Tax=Velocimicrobium porci TaxID=2606634 RepID=A0A6L5XVY3_9FIRM|nr:FliA/WhiG family RNA polymerase sigma factor [Velocimicrobium porci]MSS62985.1 FliA/WhiG family RNA polymerase sigma factor [Velocimicrobium porci]